MIVHEVCQSWGYGAEIAARIVDQLFTCLVALGTWVGYRRQLENTILPQVDDVVREAERLLNY